MKPSPVAYSYIRFSTREQAKGDSLTRQTEATRAWCAKNNVRLDESLRFNDLGRSAYTGEHRQNPDRNALASFLKMVEQGRVPKGSFLVVESLDRLTREHVQPALLLALGLLQAGIRLVQLSPAELIFDDNSDALQVMMMLMELQRGHGESKRKSDLCGSAWRKKKQKAREEGAILSRRLPAWVHKVGDRLLAIPERAEVVRRIFAMAASGHGYYATAKTLNNEKVPNFGPGAAWSPGYIGAILTDRRALGELQPKFRGGGEDGEVIKGYYPIIVSEREYTLARAGVRERDKKGGRPGAGGFINPFAGLVRSARSGDTYYAVVRPGSHGRGTPRRILRNLRGCRGGVPICSFSFDVFEKAILSCLQELDPHEILNGDGGPDETQVLAGELAVLDAKIAELAAELLHGDVHALAQVLRKLEAQKAGLVQRLQEARAASAHPAGEAWGEAQTLIGILGKAADPHETRVRLRSALRRIVHGIWLLIVPRGLDRLCAAQIWFADYKKHRDYLILHRPPRDNGRSSKPGGWACRSFVSAHIEGQLDLRRPDHVRRLERVLAGMDLTDLG